MNDHIGSIDFSALCQSYRHLRGWVGIVCCGFRPFVSADVYCRKHRPQTVMVELRHGVCVAPMWANWKLHSLTSKTFFKVDADLDI